MVEKQRKYSAEFNADAVQFRCRRSIVEIARELETIHPKFFLRSRDATYEFHDGKNSGRRHVARHLYARASDQATSVS